MPIDAIELERQRRKQGGMCSVKSVFCCLSVLFGRPPAYASGSSEKRRPSKRTKVSRMFENDDDSFGYNFDDQISPRVMTRLASDGHNFN